MYVRCLCRRFWPKFWSNRNFGIEPLAAYAGILSKQIWSNIKSKTTSTWALFQLSSYGFNRRTVVT